MTQWMMIEDNIDHLVGGHPQTIQNRRIQVTNAIGRGDLKISELCFV